MVDNQAIILFRYSKVSFLILLMGLNVLAGNVSKHLWLPIFHTKKAHLLLVLIPHMLLNLLE